jgi:4-amino-4-deoxy-L-arabinose transferase-like glycosyltransferase
MKHLDRKLLIELGTLTLFIFLSFYYGISKFALFNLDEGAFAEATREMFERGDFISTYLNGAPRYDKPILIYWLQALSVSLFGINEFAFRLPSAIAATVWIGLAWCLTRQQFDRAAATAASVILCTCITVSVIGKAATADALLNMLLAASMLSFWIYHSRQQQKYLLWTFAFIGFGFLTKGPVAVLIPFVVSGLFYASYGEFKKWLAIILNWKGILIFLAITVPWYSAQIIKEGWPFIEGFFIGHNLNRFQGPMENHSGSLFYYLPIIVLAFLPFLSAQFKLVQNIKSCWQLPLTRFLLIWFLFVLIFFSLSGTKLPHYINYGLTPLAILLALQLKSLRSRILATLPTVFVLTICLFLPPALGRVVSGLGDDYARIALSDIQNAFSTVYFVFILSGLLIITLSLLAKKLPIHKLVFLCAFFYLGIYSLFLLPVTATRFHEPVKQVAMQGRDISSPVYMWRCNIPSFSVYRHAVTPKINNPVAGQIIVTKTPELRLIEKYEILHETHGIALAQVLQRQDD